ASNPQRLASPAAHWDPTPLCGLPGPGLPKGPCRKQNVDHSPSPVAPSGGPAMCESGQVSLQHATEQGEWKFLESRSFSTVAS
ncbi:unnamed protein product, partial [Gulo gulo]